MTQLKKIILTLGLIIFSIPILQSQDVVSTWEKIKNWPKEFIEKFKEKPQFTGNVNTLFSYNYINGIPQRDNPFNYQLNASFNLKWGFLSLPFSTNFSNGQFVYNYQLPPLKLPSYNFTGLSPSYKWATLHIGDRTMTFSPYTLANHSFRGIGLELKPKKFRFAAMYGRLRRAVAEDLENPNNIEPVYKRKGWGVSIGYEDKEDAIQLIVFSAKDDSTSIPSILYNSEIKPAANTIFSVTGKKKLSDKISIEGDYAYSAFTRNQNAEVVNEEINFAKKMLGLFQPTMSSSYNLALKTSLNIKFNFADVAIIHERVQPGYRTLGALFFNDDFENWTLSTQTSLWKKKIVLSSNFGLQRNDIKNTADNQLIRFIGSANMTITPNEKLNINASYSNFRNTNKIRTSIIPLIQVDSIKLSQINQNANLTISYLTGAEKNIMFNGIFSFQNANTIENEEVLASQNNSNYMGNLMHTYIFTQSKIKLTGAILGNYNVLPTISSLSISPTFSSAIPLLNEKMNITQTASYVYVKVIETSNPNHLLNIQNNIQYKMHKKHTLGLVMNYVNKIQGDGISPDFQEFTARLTYNWNF